MSYVAYTLAMVLFVAFLFVPKKPFGLAFYPIMGVGYINMIMFAVALTEQILIAYGIHWKIMD
jgi:phage shock protein PspC (stress-responsive transcriptional regulator)